MRRIEIRRGERRVIITKTTTIRNELVGRLRQLRGMAFRTVNGMKGNHENPADVMDHASIEEYRRIELTIRGLERETIQDIESAIARIDTGKFGICEDCGESISAGRLMAKPTTTHCRSCQEKDEKDGGNGQGHPGLKRAA
jgi:DnaK suppressor protein